MKPKLNRNVLKLKLLRLKDLDYKKKPPKKKELDLLKKLRESD